MHFVSNVKTTRGYWLLAMLALSLVSVDGAERTQATEVRLGVFDRLGPRYSVSEGDFWDDAIIKEAFAKQGFSIRQLEYPAKRIYLALPRNNIDAHISSVQAMAMYNHQYIKSSLPVMVMTWYIYFDARKPWQPTWPPDAAFVSKAGRSKVSTLTLRREGLNITTAFSYSSVVKMVNLGRIDYWIDPDLSAQSLPQGLLKTRDEGYRYQALFERAIHLFFQATDRGQRLKNSFDTGYKTLLQNGEYLHHFYREDPDSSNNTVGVTSINYLRKNYPELQIPTPQSQRRQ